ncbi:MAG TPA: ATP-binding protein [Flavisolibacter sp.]|nr:ATP-binding protein [Flavisolibacter sp.]
MNLIIGKNNAGKSSLLDMIHCFAKPTMLNDPEFSGAQLILSRRLTEAEISLRFPHQKRGGSVPYEDHYSWAKKFLDTSIYYSVKDKEKILLGTEVTIEIPEALPDFQKIVDSFNDPFHGMKVYSVSAERNVKPEGHATGIGVDSYGAGVTSSIRSILNVETFHDGLIEKDLLGELNKILGPDMHFS